MKPQEETPGSRPGVDYHCNQDMGTLSRNRSRCQGNRHPRYDIEAVRRAVRPEAVFGPYLAPRTRRGRCPLCRASNATTFSVDLKRGLWHCFRCNQGGDVFAFVQAVHVLSFLEAVDYLAQRFNVAPERPSLTVRAILVRPVGQGSETEESLERRLLFDGIRRRLTNEAIDDLEAGRIEQPQYLVRLKEFNEFVDTLERSENQSLWDLLQRFYRFETSMTAAREVRT